MLLPVFGALTLVAGTALAIRQTDLKLKLAYTTVSSLGLLGLLVGFGSHYAVEAAVLYLVAHSLFKGALFMVAGIIDHETGTRDITRLAGLRGAMPLTFAAALAAAMTNEGFRIVSGGTDSHLMLVDLRPFGVNGKIAQQVLDQANITTNKNSIPNDPEKPFVTSGIRLGTPAVTTRGMKEPEMDKIATLIARAIKSRENDGDLAQVRDDVVALTRRFPIHTAE